MTSDVERVSAVDMTIFDSSEKILKNLLKIFNPTLAKFVILNDEILINQNLLISRVLPKKFKF